MKRFVFPILLFTSVVFPLHIFSQTAVIDKVWFEHNVTMNGVKGMKIFTGFHVNNAAGRTLDLSVNHYFVYLTSGGPVRGKTTGHWAPGPDGYPQACAWNRFNFNAKWNPTYMNESWVFAPYNDLMVPPGAFDLAVVTFIRDCGREQFIQESTNQMPFTFTGNTSGNYNPNAYNNRPNNIVNGGNSSYNSNNSSYNSNNNSSTNHNNTPIRKTCTRCKGTKRVVYERNVNSSYGLEMVMVTCSECGKRYDKTSTVHRHEICTSCNGLGY